MRASSFHSKKDGLAERANVQLDLFDHSVREHTVAARLLCIRHAPKARCMMSTTPQVWPAYRQAQVNEKSRFQSLLYELCRGIEEPMQHMGRPRLPIADVIFALCYKVYSTFSSRRFSGDLKEAHAKGYLSKMPSYNSVCDYFQMEYLTAYLKQLIIESSLPLKSVEHDFAVDSSGFSTGIYKKWVDTKWGKPEFKGKRKPVVQLHDWVKVHLMCGVKTNVVTAIEITHARGGDSPQFAPLVETTSQNFAIREVSADKAYSAAKNLQLVLVKGAQPYIPFRKNTNVNSYWDNRQPSVWKKMFHQFMANRDEFMQHYHKRSNVETTFSMIKGKFGERLRSKSAVAQTNEVLCKVLCHNLCCVIQSIYELGIEPSFWND